MRYYIDGEDMTIYVDLVFFLNFFFDFLLLLTVNNTLKRNIPLKRIFLGALIGSLTIFLLFLNLSSFLLFLLKIIIAFIMCIVAFGLKDKAYLIQNISYFYMTSTVLGGFLYFLNLTFQETHNGLIFSYNTLSVNYLFLVISSPIILFIYIRQRKEMAHYQNFYPLTISLKDGHNLTLNAYYDTGNKLSDPITKKKIVLVDAKKIKNIPNFYYVPYNSLNHQGLIKCFKVNYIEINGKKSSNYLIGISESNLLKDGVDAVLNQYCKEDLL